MVMNMRLVIVPIVAVLVLSRLCCVGMAGVRVVVMGPVVFVPVWVGVRVFMPMWVAVDSPARVPVGMLVKMMMCMAVFMYVAVARLG
jgi:hypothetical protein